MMLTEINKKLKIALVIAHPDDETLWFYGGLKKLAEQHDISILCLTYAADSERGKELLNAVANFKVNCYFGNLEDVGFNKCLYSIRLALKKFLDDNCFEQPFDIMITHPFHGGEKPHPHHIQAFHAVKQLCRKRKIVFGFFAEKRLPLKKVGKFKFRFSLWILLYHNLCFIKLLTKSSANNNLFLFELLRLAKETVLDLFTKKKIFVLNRFSVESSDKINNLQIYESQIHHLLKYQSINESVEYLYLEIQ